MTLNVSLIYSPKDTDVISEFLSYSADMRKADSLLVTGLKESSRTIVLVTQGFIDDGRCKQDLLLAEYYKKPIHPIFAKRCNYYDNSRLKVSVGLNDRWIFSMTLSPKKEEWEKVMRAIQRLM